MSAAAAALDAPPRRRLDDRLNPILVKEVRQAMRGRYFRVLFWFALTTATLVGLAVVAEAAADDSVAYVGPTFFLWVFGILAGAVHAFVPFSAFLSTSAEWDENTWDLLVISNLKPRQLVLGKLYSALIQSVLFYSAFSPFLVFAFLLNGVDLLSIAVIVPGSMVTCGALSLLGIALASLARVRFLRIVLMAVFGAALVFATMGTIAMAAGIVRFPELLRDPEARIAIAAYVTAAGLLGGLAFTVAAARFAHEEENRSTGLRIVSLAAVIAAGAWSAWALAEIGEEAAVWVCQFIAALVTFPFLTFFLTEGEALGRRSAHRIPRNGVLALLCMPFLPGGGRAVWLWFLHFAVALAASALVLATASKAPTPDEFVEVLAVVALIYGYSFLYIGLTSGIASFFVRTLRWRAVVRSVIVVLVPLSVFLPALVGLFLGVRDWMNFRHPLNPIEAIDEVGDSSRSVNLTLAVVILLLGGSLGLMLNLRRMWRGWREVAAQSRARRAAGHAAP